MNMSNSGESYSYYTEPHNLSNVINCQALWRGIWYRKNNLPNSIRYIQCILRRRTIQLSNQSNDGRVNSCLDENEITKILQQEIPERIYIPKHRKWYDILICDFTYGLLPVNIKTTTTKTSDNIGNLAICMYAYTNEKMSLHKDYQNGDFKNILPDKLATKQYNVADKRDYYFVVINKTYNNDIIVNSLKGLSVLTSNLNNLPFQVCWKKNRDFEYKKIDDVVKKFIIAIQKPKPSWQETFLYKMRSIEL